MIKRELGGGNKAGGGNERRPFGHHLIYNNVHINYIFIVNCMIVTDILYGWMKAG